MMYPCPSCGFLVFGEPPGSYAICSVCAWEDDELQLRFPGYSGGANHYSLGEYQRRFCSQIPEGIEVYLGYRRYPEWRPLRPDECVAEPDDRTPLAYYWNRPTPAA